MALLDIPLNRITEADVRRLIAAGAAESLYIDYKQATYGGKEADHAELLADVSSFANTAGGDLVIGVAEAGGIPNAIVPFTGNADDERRRLEDIARTGLEPRIRNLQTRAVALVQGGAVIIVRVPRSYAPPHRVIYKNRSRFWARASSGKYEPNVEELRHIFTEAPRIAERIAAFRTDRIVRITAGETPVPLGTGGKVVLHLVPVPAFADGRLLDVVSAVAAGTHVPLPLDGMGGGNRPGINIDGFLNYADRPAGGRQSYAQFFRSGAIEGVGNLSKRDADGYPYFVAAEFANRVVVAVRQYLSVLEAFDAGLPVYAFLSLCDVAQCFYRYSPDGAGWSDTGPLNREVLALPELYIDNFRIDVPVLMRPVFNMLWNAFGFQQCEMYDEQGAWKGK
jgi:hypothetical protein